MRRMFTLCMAGAITLAMSGSALAIAIPAAQLCSDKLQNETLLYVNAVQKQVRLSIKNNIKGKDSKCSGGFSCAGGPNNGKTCVDNSTCTPGQCAVNAAKGIAGSINKSKGKLRAKFAQFCTNANLIELFGTDGNTRCPDPSTPDNGLTADEIADCVLQGAIGDLANSVFGDPAGEILARAASDVVPDAGLTGVCAVTLGSILSIGSEAGAGDPAEAGGANPLIIDSCLAGVCDTSSAGIIGNNLTAPTQTFAGVIPVCLVTTTGNSGNGTPADGQINLNTGEGSIFSPISSSVLIGTTCPVCDAVTKLCDSGALSGGPCTNAGTTDTACPPSGAGPIIPNPLDLDTEANTLSIPANNPIGGVTNPAGTFCGACDVDNSFGCQNDQDCVDEGVCSGAVGSGCCVFGTNTGAFGDDGAIAAEANGTRSQYLPQMATIFCTGVSNDGLVDSTQGLPGPVRLIQAQLNAFTY